MRERKKKRIIIFSLLGLLCIMTVGYAAFQSNLKIKGTSSVSGNWDIRITNVTEGTKTGSGTTTLDENGNQKITFDELTASVEADLIEVNDAVEYNVTVENKGNINAKLDSIDLIKTNNTGIKFTVTMLKDGKEITDINEMKKYPLNAGEIANFKIKIEYETKVEAPISSELSITLNYAQLTGNESDIPDPDLFTGTLYRWTTDVLEIGSSIEKIDVTTEASTLEKNYYLKHEVVDNKITTSYVCFVTDTEHCMKPNEYEKSKALIQSQETVFTDNGGYCSEVSSNLSRLILMVLFAFPMIPMHFALLIVMVVQNVFSSLSHIFKQL